MNWDSDMQTLDEEYGPGSDLVAAKNGNHAVSGVFFNLGLGLYEAAQEAMFTRWIDNAGDNQ